MVKNYKSGKYTSFISLLDKYDNIDDKDENSKTPLDLVNQTGDTKIDQILSIVNS